MNMQHFSDQLSSIYTIRELCEEFGLTPRTLRFYEDKSLLKPWRRNHMRVYSGEDRARLKLILRGKRLGFSLVELREMLGLYSRKRDLVALECLYGKYRVQLKSLEDRRADIDIAISEMERGVRRIERTIHRQESGA